MYFSMLSFSILILTALALMTIGVVSLIVFLMKDIKSKELW